MWKGKFLYTVKAYVILLRARRVIVVDLVLFILSRNVVSKLFCTDDPF